MYQSPQQTKQVIVVQTPEQDTFWGFPDWLLATVFVPIVVAWIIHRRRKK